MKKITAVLLAVVLMASCFMAGCSKKKDEVVNVYNWGENIDESIFDDFYKETGIKVNYTTYDSNEILYANLTGGGTSYDVIIPSDYMIARLISENMLQELDFKNIPNFANIFSRFKNLQYDPENKYSVPYTWGTMGLIYNSALIEERPTSWNALFDAKYKGQILMFDNPRDAAAIALLMLGYDLNTTDEAEITAAFNLLKTQKPILQGYFMDQMYDKLEGGEAVIGAYYAGDALVMMENNPDLVYVVPDEGANWFVDAMCIPKSATNKANAEAFINFMCKSDIALRNMDVTCYATPVETAYNQLDEETRDNEIMFPGDDILSKCSIYTNLPESTNTLYSRLWEALKVNN